MKSAKKLSIGIFWFLFLLVSGVKAQVGTVTRDGDKKPTLVILGTYHMGTSGRHFVDSKTDDVSSPKRQKQMVALVEKLKQFYPTKILLECDTEKDEKMNALYRQYRSGNYQLSKNETNQIGFRLADKLAHSKVYCVDWGIFPKDPLYNYETYSAKYPPLKKYLEGLRSALQEEVNADNQKMATLSITNQLISLNQPERIEQGHQGYYDLLRLGRGQEHVGANWLTWWYGRNLKILYNIIDLTESPDDRILVVFGAGHLKLLTQFAVESGFYHVQSPLEYLVSRE